MINAVICSTMSVLYQSRDSVWHSQIIRIAHSLWYTEYVTSLCYWHICTTTNNYYMLFWELAKTTDGPGCTPSFGYVTDHVEDCTVILILIKYVQKWPRVDHNIVYCDTVPANLSVRVAVSFLKLCSSAPSNFGQCQYYFIRNTKWSPQIQQTI